MSDMLTRSGSLKTAYTLVTQAILRPIPIALRLRAAPPANSGAKLWVECVCQYRSGPPESSRAAASAFTGIRWFKV